MIYLRTKKTLAFVSKIKKISGLSAMLFCLTGGLLENCLAMYDLSNYSEFEKVEKTVRKFKIVDPTLYQLVTYINTTKQQGKIGDIGNALIFKSNNNWYLFQAGLEDGFVKKFTPYETEGNLELFCGSLPDGYLNNIRCFSGLDVLLGFMEIEEDQKIQSIKANIIQWIGNPIGANKKTVGIDLLLQSFITYCEKVNEYISSHCVAIDKGYVSNKATYNSVRIFLEGLKKEGNNYTNFHHLISMLLGIHNCDGVKRYHEDYFSDLKDINVLKWLLRAFHTEIQLMVLHMSGMLKIDMDTFILSLYNACCGCEDAKTFWYILNKNKNKFLILGFDSQHKEEGKSKFDPYCINGIDVHLFNPTLEKEYKLKSSERSSSLPLICHYGESQNSKSQTGREFLPISLRSASSQPIYRNQQEEQPNSKPGLNKGSSVSFASPEGKEEEKQSDSKAALNKSSSNLMSFADLLKEEKAKAEAERDCSNKSLKNASSQPVCQKQQKKQPNSKPALNKGSSVSFASPERKEKEKQSNSKAALNKGSSVSFASPERKEKEKQSDSKAALNKSSSNLMSFADLLKEEKAKAEAERDCNKSLKNASSQPVCQSRQKTQSDSNRNNSQERLNKPKTGRSKSRKRFNTLSTTSYQKK